MSGAAALRSMLDGCPASRCRTRIWKLKRGPSPLPGDLPGGGVQDRTQ
jgi:hypothetical protein